MPIKTCTSGGKPGYKWGDTGKCYTYTAGNEASRKAAKAKAIKQAVAAAYKGGKQVAKVDLAKGAIPDSCVCPECGYVLKNPTKHCPELKCPKCGEAMRKQKPGTGGGQGKGGPQMSDLEIQMQEITEKSMPLAVCGICLYEAHGFVDGADPITLPCPVCNGKMEDPAGFQYVPTTFEALKLHYRPWTEGVKKPGIE